MDVKTGYGYLKDIEEHIVSKYDFPIGRHSLKEGYTFVEVANKEELNHVEIYVPPKTADEVREEKIHAEIRQLAIDSLIAKGEITK